MAKTALPTWTPHIQPPLVRNGASRYAPLSSIWEGSDGDLLEAMFTFYATIPPEPILDATYNAGRFWKGSPRQVVSMRAARRSAPNARIYCRFSFASADVTGSLSSNLSGSDSSISPSNSSVSGGSVDDGADGPG